MGRIHDFCGALEEENLRTNFVLIYELIDEIIVRCLHTPHFARTHQFVRVCRTMDILRSRTQKYLGIM